MTTIAQRSFSGGEIAPSLYARTDTVKYSTGLRTCRNFFIARHGGAYNRPGTTFIGEVKDSSKRVKLIPFIFNADQTYVIELGNQYIRFIRNGAYITLTAQNITGVTNANPAVLTYSGSDTYANGDEVYISGISGAIGTYLNNRNFKVANVNTGANTFELQYLDGTNVNSTSFGSYGSGGTIAEVYTITSPYLEADLQNIQYVQSADIITLVHPSYEPRELSRSAHTSWALNTITFAPVIAAPGTPTVTPQGAAGAVTYNYRVTSIAEETFEESLASNTGTTTTGNASLSSTNFNRITWSSVSGAQEYNVYKERNGVYGFIGVAAGSGTVQFDDIGITPDISDTPPTARNPFSGTDNYPSTVTYFQQRLMLANTNNDTETIYGSRTANFHNFTISNPIQDDDAVTFSIVGKQVNAVKHLVDIGNLVVFTTAGEWLIQGDSAGILRPGEINPKQESYNGSGDLPPIVINGNAIYLQARESIVRDLTFDYQVDGYRGNDLTIFSSHLFDGYSLQDWTYQQTPNSIIWAVRDDGTLLGLTYIREHQIFAWHRHDFEDATVENVVSIPSSSVGEDELYLVIKRTVNSATKRYVEKMNTRFVEFIEDSIFMDSTLSYDGTHLGATTMTLSGGTNWTYDETLTLTASASSFLSSDVGNQIHLTGSDGTLIRFTIGAYSSATVVTGKPQMTVPVSMRSTAISTWGKAVDELSGLWHLEGKQVSVLGDGFVVANPNNEAYTTLTVTNGTVTLSQPHVVIHVGLPITADLQTLNIDFPDSNTMADRNKLIQEITIFLESSRGIWAGSEPPPDEDDDFLGGLYELKIRDVEGYNDPVRLVTDTVKMNIQPQWNNNGRVFIRQTDPLPLAILSIAPAGLFGVSR